MYHVMQMPACDALSIYLSGTPVVDSCLADAWVADRSTQTSPIGGSDDCHPGLLRDARWGGVKCFLILCVCNIACSGAVVAR